MNAATRRLVAFTALVVSGALPLAACESDENPTRDPGTPVTSAELTKLGCC
ncbi:MAG: hypothetical protein F2754_11200 [Actinobacteria bacterium]|uniref:Unannotated protein n=1 Tax=freshwater metagenome TaxID=449393 RepID=A0A6J6T939_9ZZZZ|nr:hypothetical protein [Actinomycetota bacterium]MSX87938.1 hypothetical protein [Actinomycetota bacterium]MSY71676.1 hypothetical protein [Actinomycetota bacterium]